MKPSTILLAASLAAVPLAPDAAFAFGAIGCPDLPEHDRAIGALEGMTGACDMSVERARQILARDAGAQQAVVPPGYGPPGYGSEVAPPPRHRRHRHHREQR